MNTVEAVLKRDRLVAISALAGATALAWAYTLSGAGMDALLADGRTVAGAMTRPMAWSAGAAIVMFVMWWVMMIAMMLPSAAPTILLYTAIRRKQDYPRPAADGLVFGFGYLLCWAAFSLIATMAQWALARSGLLTPMLASAKPAFGGVLLLAAGLYQFTPIKHACLSHCRSPVHFIAAHWRAGRFGALNMGWRHGLFCVGCCWALMALLFFGGVMNPLWIAGLAIYVLGEKLMPRGNVFGIATGVILSVLGIYLLVGHLA